VSITQFAEANEVDLIVMSTRGLSGLSRWLMGSVADRVVRGATVPVLLVRAAKERE
jgi:nucleotide-binding universal stress UspA family protein